jgi:hypothetical protein
VAWSEALLEVATTETAKCLLSGRLNVLRECRFRYRSSDGSEVGGWPRQEGTLQFRTGARPEGTLEVRTSDRGIAGLKLDQAPATADAPLLGESHVDHAPHRPAIETPRRSKHRRRHGGFFTRPTGTRNRILQVHTFRLLAGMYMRHLQCLLDGDLVVGRATIA